MLQSNEWDIEVKEFVLLIPVRSLSDSQYLKQNDGAQIKDNKW